MHVARICVRARVRACAYAGVCPHIPAECYPLRAGLCICVHGTIDGVAMGCSVDRRVYRHVWMVARCCIGRKYVVHGRDAGSDRIDVGTVHSEEPLQLV